MEFYPSKNNNALNRQPFDPDVVTGRAMVNPHYRVLVHPATAALCDSGAFQDDDIHRPRLQPWQALTRQLEYETWLSWQIVGHPGWHFRGIVTYDQMFGVDECMVDGVKVKRRGTDATAYTAGRVVLEVYSVAPYLRQYVGGRQMPGATIRDMEQTVQQVALDCRAALGVDVAVTADLILQAGQRMTVVVEA